MGPNQDNPGNFEKDHSLFDQLQHTRLTAAFDHQIEISANVLEYEEAQRYLDLAGLNGETRSTIYSRVATSAIDINVGTFGEAQLKQFAWHGTVLGEFTIDRDEGIRKGIRYIEYEKMYPLAFNSATLSPPNVHAARAAYIVASTLAHCVQTENIHALEQTVANVSRNTFERLCERYRVGTSCSEVLFDDNATMALFQWLAMLPRKSHDYMLTFFDTGRIIPEALAGKNPEFLPDNFHPALDVWGNRERAAVQPIDLTKNDYDLVEHYTDRYLSNSEVLDDVIRIIETTHPAVILLPTVTRAGRRLPFIEFCQAIRDKANNLGYDPIIILDDAQGLGRMISRHYNYRADGRKAELWDYVDAVLATGAKVVGALMGSGVLLCNRERFATKQIAIEDSPLRYRARQYSLISDDLARIACYNGCASGVAQSPELASLSIALTELPRPEEVYGLMQSVRAMVVMQLKKISGITVLEPGAAVDAKFEDSIVTFYLTNHPRSGASLRRALAEPRENGDVELDSLPITLPAIIHADKREYLRLSFDPARVVLESQYLRKINYVLDCIHKIVARDFA